MVRRNRRIKFDTKPPASRYQSPSERIVEFSSPNGGGLISLLERQDGILSIEFYRLDRTVEVVIPKQ